MSRPNLFKSPFLTPLIYMYEKKKKKKKRVWNLALADPGTLNEKRKKLLCCFKSWCHRLIKALITFFTFERGDIYLFFFLWRDIYVESL